MNKPEQCGHHDVYVEHVRDYKPQPMINGRVFSVSIICKECGARLKGEVQQQQ